MEVGFKVGRGGKTTGAAEPPKVISEQVEGGCIASGSGAHC